MFIFPQIKEESLVIHWTPVCETVLFLQEDLIPVLKITESAPLKQLTQSQWAEELDVSHPVTDFEKKVPTMAKTWPFELDTFQKKVSC